MSWRRSNLHLVGDKKNGWNLQRWRLQNNQIQQIFPHLAACDSSVRHGSSCEPVLTRAQHTSMLFMVTVALLVCFHGNGASVMRRMKVIQHIWANTAGCFSLHGSFIIYVYMFEWKLFAFSSKILPIRSHFHQLIRNYASAAAHLLKLVQHFGALVQQTHLSVTICCQFGPIVETKVTLVCNLVTFEAKRS